MSVTKRLVVIPIILFAITAFAQQPKPTSAVTVEVKVSVSEAEVGQQVKLTVVAKDAAGNILNEQPTSFFARPFDIAAADDTGVVRLFGPGEVTAGAVFIPVRGICHVLDISDINHPRKVAEYPVPEGGAHNIWVEDGIMYMGYYSGGGRVVDVSGELRGDLYRQGREIGRVWTGDPEGYRTNLPFTWGAQPHK